MRHLIYHWWLCWFRKWTKCTSSFAMLVQSCKNIIYMRFTLSFIRSWTYLHELGLFIYIYSWFLWWFLSFIIIIHGFISDNSRLLILLNSNTAHFFNFSFVSHVSKSIHFLNLLCLLCIALNHELLATSTRGTCSLLICWVWSVCILICNLTSFILRCLSNSLKLFDSINFLLLILQFQGFILPFKLFFFSIRLL